MTEQLNTNSHKGDVAILVHKDWKHLITLACAISNRVIYVMIQLNDRYTSLVIQAYAPTSAAENVKAERSSKHPTFLIGH